MQLNFISFKSFQLNTVFNFPGLTLQSFPIFVMVQFYSELKLSNLIPNSSCPFSSQLKFPFSHSYSSCPFSSQSKLSILIPIQVVHSHPNSSCPFSSKSKLSILIPIQVVHSQPNPR